MNFLTRNHNKKFKDFQGLNINLIDHYTVKKAPFLEGNEFRMKMIL